MFNAEGNYPVEIKEMMLGECRRDEDKGWDNAFDVCILVQTYTPDQPIQSDWWRGTVNHRMGTGKAAGKTQMEMTFNALEKIGIPDMQTLMNHNASGFSGMLGFKTEVSVDSWTNTSGKTYYNPKYLGASTFRPDTFDQNELQRRMQAMSQPPQAAPAYGAQPAQPNGPQPAPVYGQPQTTAPVQQQYAQPAQTAPAGGFPATPGQPQAPQGGTFQPPAPTQPALPGQTLPGQATQPGHAG